MNEKHGGFKYLDISRKSWEYWCKKNDAIFLPYELEDVSERYKNLNLHRVTWTRWFDLFPLLEKKNLNPNKILMVDGSTIIRWDAPNFFDLAPGEGLTVFKSLENVRWLFEGVKGYRTLFDNFEFDITKYFTCGWQLFTKGHREFLEDLEAFYNKNYAKIMHLQNTATKRGTDQPVYNYLAQIKDIQLNIDVLPKKYLLTHLNRFEWLGHNWQLNSKTPHFINHGYIWMFSGFPQRGERYEIMSNVWDLIKNRYE